MATTQEDINKVKERKSKASALAYEANKIGASSQTFKDRVMEGVRSRRAERGTSTLESAVGYTTGQLASAPADMRARLSNVNPLQADALTARQTGQTLSTLATLGEVGQAREGTIGEAIGAGTNKLLGMADLKRAEAERAASEAEAITNQIQLSEAVEKRKFDEWEARERLGLAREELGIKKSKADADDADDADYIDDINGYRGLIKSDEISVELAIKHLRKLYPEKTDSDMRSLLVEAEATEDVEEEKPGFFQNLFSGRSSSQPQAPVNIPSPSYLRGVVKT